MKPAHILTLEALAILALLVAVMLTDDPLNPEAEAWLEIVNNTEDIEGNGYYYLFGIAADAADDPSAFGRRQADLYREAVAALRAEDLANLDFSLEKPLSLPQGDVYCRLHENGCLQQLFDNPETLQSELEAHSHLHERYHRFLQFRTFKTLTKPHLFETFPPYEYVSRGNKLLQFQVILDALQGNRHQAVEALLNNIQHMRTHLEVADSLIYKLILVTMLAENLELLTHVHDPAINEPIPALDPLTYEERSLHRPMVREFGMSANTLMHFAENPRVFGEELETPHWLAYPFFKSHMTVNDAFRIHQSVHRLAQLSPPAFYQSINPDSSHNQAPFSVRNFVGWLFGLMASEDVYKPYIARINNIDCKIALVNAVLPLSREHWQAIMQGSAAVPAVQNPYAPEQSPTIDAETESLCFSGPYNDHNGSLCVKKYRVDSKQSVDM